MKKRVWSIILTLVMVAALFPATLLTASAAVVDADADHVITTSDAWIEKLTISTPSAGSVKVTFTKPTNTTGAPANFLIAAWGGDIEDYSGLSGAAPSSDGDIAEAYGGHVDTPMEYAANNEFTFTVPANKSITEGSDTYKSGYADFGEAGVDVYIGIATGGAGSWVVGKFTLPKTGKFPTAQCTITWDDQGATTASSGGPSSVDQGAAVGKLPTTPPQKTGYRFDGWYTAANGGGTKVTASTTTPNASTVTYYAHWKQLYTVTYALGGGNGTLPTHADAVQGEEITLAASTGLTKTGYTFSKWNDGTSDYAAGAQYTMPGNNVTLTATWTANELQMAAISNISLKKDEAMTEVTLPEATNGTGDYTYATSGALPTGLNIDTTTRKLTGTPTALTAADGVEITWKAEDTNSHKTVEKKFKITVIDKTPATWTSGPDSVTATYGDTDKSVACTVNSGATPTYTVTAGGDVVTVVGTDGKLTIAKPGTATIKVSAPAKGEFGAPADKTITVTVDPKKVAVADLTLNEGDEFPTTAEVTGKIGAEDVSVTLSWTDEEGALGVGAKLEKGKTYTWTATLTGTDAGNYELEKSTDTVSLSSGGGIVISGSKQTYTVTYNVGSHGNFSSDAATTEKVEKNETPKNVPVVHPHDNYRFMGWSLDGKTVVDPTTQKITKNVTFTALYEACDHMAYMVGRSDTEFAPNGNLTRAEAATILSRLTEGFDENGTYPAAPYSDLNTNAWYAKYVNFAASKGIVNGRPDGSFDPDASITRAEFATMIANFAGVGRVEAPSASNDVAGHWAAGYIVALERAGIVTGYEDGTFRPNANITRAEAATMVNGAIGRTPDTALDLAANSYTNPFADVNAGQWFFAQVMEATVNHVTAHFHTEK